jgi:S1-C subfamily serine protease
LSGLLFIVVSAVLVLAPSALASPVIDDAALEEKFTQGLNEPEVVGLSGEQSAQAVEEAEGKKVRVARDAGLAASAEYADASRAVVVIGSIEHCQECEKFHMGAVSSGWVIDPRGFIATNYHVMEDKEAGEIGVMDRDGKVYAVRKVIAADRAGDAAIIEIETGGAELRAFPLAGSVKTGEPVSVIGHPDGRFYSLTEGIVSRVFAEATDDDGKDRCTWITVTADYGSGSSGAPVLNAAGEVVGMVSSTAALLADPEQDKEPKAEDVQMVFRDCVSIDTIRGLLQP